MRPDPLRLWQTTKACLDEIVIVVFGEVADTKDKRADEGC
jgi:hypothetical protein